MVVEAGVAFLREAELAFRTSIEARQTKLAIGILRTVLLAGRSASTGRG